MAAFEISVTVPARTPRLFDEPTGEWVGGELIPGADPVSDVMVVERDTLAEAESAALEAFGVGAQLAGSSPEVPTEKAPTDG